MEDLRPFTPIGYTNFRNGNTPFGILPADRLYHIWAFGKTGMGKSTLLIRMAVDDIRKGYGVCVLDPHGDTVSAIKNLLPAHRRADVIHFDAGDTRNPPAYNPLCNVPPEQRHLVASEIVLTFKRLWESSWGPRLEYILKYCILALLEYPGATLLDIPPLLLDKGFRNLVLQYTENEAILSFWMNEFEKYPPNLRADAIMPILNKAGVFRANAILRGIVGRQEGLSLDEAMNTGKILLCTLSKGQVGEEVSALLGSLLVTGIQTAAMRRASLPVPDRRLFFVYLDEAHSFLSTSFATMLSEVRKYAVGLFITHQYMEQLSEDVRNAVLGNVASVICFRLGSSDAKVMEEEFWPVFKREDFVNLPQFQVYLKLSINGATSKGFSATVQGLINPRVNGNATTSCIKSLAN